ncbi:RNA 3'-terminal phosphate cyclase (ATP) [Halarchaeum rubridurum]|uniref:RNA 3'-terminal phosphate cyclase n=1 Tax=Halarchaeum rubridurum TaxID=489911 RepID=A0A830G3K4_9EURY|nr:RNA 3'-terminal phosphate cyclase [Halarchaeum rubridurum]MBP1955469.1 RNA 3'-terminal phosphate cyclase (ATP) [Halarchaeum rubridurum]GGM72579.1 RNA 3'-phosphate cyclase [Halarchaeum rubridurum]
MRSISGARGGGQLVRSAAAFACLTGEAVAVTDVRAARETPGLKRQHVAALDALAAITDADLDGARVGSERVAIDPGPVAGGDARVEIGTAGSVPLVVDAVLPLAARLDDPFRLTVTGGTDVRWAPPLDYLRCVKLPLLRAHGLDASLTCERRGFYPAGGGAVTLTLRPSDLDSLSLSARGARRGIDVRSVASESLADADVAERQADAARDALPGDGETSVAYVPADSPGSVVTLVARYAGVRAGFSALGERGKPADDVAREAVAAFEAFEATAASVDTHLADQLLPFAALAGGEYVAPERTAHLETHAALLETFGVDVTLANDADGETKGRGDTTKGEGDARAGDGTESDGDTDGPVRVRVAPGFSR